MANGSDHWTPTTPFKVTVSLARTSPYRFERWYETLPQALSALASQYNHTEADAQGASVLGRVDNYFTNQRHTEVVAVDPRGVYA